jgi:hypothetical protein
LQSLINHGAIEQIDRARLQEVACSTFNTSDVDNKDQHQQQEQEQEKSDKTIHDCDNNYCNNESDEDDKILRPAKRKRVSPSYGDPALSNYRLPPSHQNQTGLKRSISK